MTKSENALPKTPNTPEKTPKAHHEGHRQRLRQRFLDGGPEALPDYEVLELLLFLAKPRGDVKPLAKDLLKHFGSFAAIISASREDLMRVNGMGDAAVAALKVAQASALRLLKDDVINKPVLTSWQRLIDYCRAEIGYEKIERFHVLYLNKKNVLIADEAQGRGTVDHTPVYPREVIKRALELGATALILVHNHPSGDPKPSKADIAITQDVVDAGDPLGIVVHDHIIVSPKGSNSFKAMGLL